MQALRGADLQTLGQNLPHPSLTMHDTKTKDYWHDFPENIGSERMNEVRGMAKQEASLLASSPITFVVHRFCR